MSKQPMYNYGPSQFEPPRDLRSPGLFDDSIDDIVDALIGPSLAASFPNHLTSPTMDSMNSGTTSNNNNNNNNNNLNNNDEGDEDTANMLLRTQEHRSYSVKSKNHSKSNIPNERIMNISTTQMNKNDSTITSQTQKKSKKRRKRKHRCRKQNNNNNNNNSNNNNKRNVMVGSQTPNTHMQWQTQGQRRKQQMIGQQTQRQQGQQQQQQQQQKQEEQQQFESSVTNKQRRIENEPQQQREELQRGGDRVSIALDWSVANQATQATTTSIKNIDISGINITPPPPVFTPPPMQYTSTQGSGESVASLFSNDTEALQAVLRGANTSNTNIRNVANGNNSTVRSFLKSKSKTPIKVVVPRSPHEHNNQFEREFSRNSSGTMQGSNTFTSPSHLTVPVTRGSGAGTCSSNNIINNNNNNNNNNNIGRNGLNASMRRTGNGNNEMSGINRDYRYPHTFTNRVPMMTTSPVRNHYEMTTPQANATPYCWSNAANAIPAQIQTQTQNGPAQTAPAPAMTPTPNSFVVFFFVLFCFVFNLVFSVLGLIFVFVLFLKTKIDYCARNHLSTLASESEVWSRV